MSNVTTPVAVETVATTTETVATTETVVATPAVPKAPSKKSLATAIFAAKMIERAQGLFASNKEFRASVLNAIVADLGVSIPSAATMFNACKIDAEKADANVGLGRDPKQVKVKAQGTGKKGRPSGSKNKVAEVVVVSDVAAAVVEAAATEEGSGYAAPSDVVAA